jgi:hypothetical protein
MGLRLQHLPILGRNLGLRQIPMDLDFALAPTQFGPIFRSRGKRYELGDGEITPAEDYFLSILQSFQILAEMGFEVRDIDLVHSHIIGHVVDPVNSTPLGV